MTTAHESRLQVVYLNITALQPNPKNARSHSSKQIKVLARVIKKLGFNNPILIDRDNMVIAGHGRLEAAKQLGLEEVPTILLENLTLEEVIAFQIADNRIAEMAEWDMPALKLELEALSALNLNFDLTLTGFETPKLDMILNPMQQAEEEKPIPPIGDQPVTQLGDIWDLGQHRIICGDALKAESYAQLLEDEKANLIFTDPPYNVPIAGHVLVDDKNRHGEFAMACGEMSDEEFEAFLCSVIAYLQQYSTNGSVHYICMDWRHIVNLIAAGRSYEAFMNICIWNKTNGGMGSLYRSKYEMVCVFKNGKEPHINNIELGKHGRYRTNVWDYAGQTSFHGKRGKELAMHPTVKPVEMIADAILDCSDRNHLILDPFGGSGSTLIAAEKTGRRARLIEIEPRYVDVTILRWQQLTGQSATLSATGQSFDAVKAERQGGAA